MTSRLSLIKLERTYSRLANGLGFVSSGFLFLNFAAIGIEETAIWSTLSLISLAFNKIVISSSLASSKYILSFCSHEEKESAIDDAHLSIFLTAGIVFVFSVLFAVFYYDSSTAISSSIVLMWLSAVFMALPVRCLQVRLRLYDEIWKSSFIELIANLASLAGFIMSLLLSDLTIATYVAVYFIVSIVRVLGYFVATRNRGIKFTFKKDYDKKRLKNMLRASSWTTGLGAIFIFSSYFPFLVIQPRLSSESADLWVISYRAASLISVLAASGFAGNLFRLTSEKDSYAKSIFLRNIVEYGVIFSCLFFSIFLVLIFMESYLSLYFDVINIAIENCTAIVLVALYVFSMRMCGFYNAWETRDSQYESTAVIALGMSSGVITYTIASTVTGSIFSLLTIPLLVWFVLLMKGTKYFGRRRKNFI